MRGHLWFIRRYGVRAWFRYERMRRAGIVIAYDRVFKEDELAIIAEHFAPAPWERD